MMSNGTNALEPFAFQPSGVWDGIDGNWSSFIIQVGTPDSQEFRVLPSTVGQEIIVPLPEGCTTDDPSNCSTTRGVIEFQGQESGFLANESDTWRAAGLFTSSLEQRLGYQVNALYGYDTVSLGSAEQSPINEANQVVAGIAAKDFYLGVFGLGLGTVDFGSDATSGSTYLNALKNSTSIPSVSFGYTAGASYRDSLGSLTLGGYDPSRFTSSDASFPMNDSAIVASLQSILGQDTLNGTRALLSSSIQATIDSTLPYIWLPQEACDAFVEAFGLIYDNTTDLYLSNETIRQQLLQTPPTVTFVFGNFGQNTQSIALPYSALDLRVTYPLYESPTYYFPIRRAANETQYTIGRALLQEAYLIVDYERQNFTVAEAVHSDSTNSTSAVAIHPPTTLTTKPTTSTTLSTGVIVGIAIGVVVLLGALVGVYFFFRQRRRRHQTLHDPNTSQKHDSGHTDEKAGAVEAEDTPLHEMPASARLLSEVDGETAKWGGFGAQELHTPPNGLRHELAADIRAHEMVADQPVYELAGSTLER